MRENFKISAPNLPNLHKGIADKWKKMTNKEKIIMIFRLIIIIVCTFGLFYQAIQLLQQYNLGMTVVTISYQDKNYHHIPGITICYPAALSMAKVAEKYPELKPLYEEYIERISEEDSDKNNTGQIDNNIYSNSFTKFIYNGDVYKRDGSKIIDYFDISIPFGRDQRGRNAIKVETFGISRNGSTILPFSSKVSDDTPIESLVFKNRNTWKKCFTFYSHLNKKWRDYQMDITKMIITVAYNQSWFPKRLLIDQGLQLSIHSPNELPRHDVEYHLDLKANHYIEMTYNRWKTQLLGKGYKTNCRDYNLEDKHYKNRMRSQCIKHCIQQILIPFTDCNKTNTCERCVVPTSVLWTNTELIENNLTNVCHYTINPFFASVSGESSCHSECNHKCVERYYNYEIKSISDKEYPDSTTISIKHNQLPDQINEHIPEMTFLQFCANFGGLLGIWMGLSALAIFKYIIKFFFG